MRILEADEILSSGALHMGFCVEEQVAERGSNSPSVGATFASDDTTSARHNGNGNLGVTGTIAVLELNSGVSVEGMDYTFHQPTIAPYDCQNPFIEFLQLESVCALSRQEGNTYPITPGLYVNLCQEDKGELVFSADIPIRGLRIRVPLTAYDRHIQRRFPKDAPSHTELRKQSALPFGDLSVNLIAQQIRQRLEGGVSSELFYESKLMELFHAIGARRDMAEQSAASSGPLTPIDLRAMERVRMALTTHFAAPPQAKELAEIANASLSKLYRDFKIAYGSTIQVYLRRFRMERALDLLRVTDDPLHAIARSVGYQKPGNFSRAFRQVYGVSPNQLRGQLRASRPR